ncbi:MAG TPA: hypothetical protein VHV75_04240 [Solirubrobacteraceae bacterium]|jgi:hypothetical protein|nr:hypothetical protein [Solirubrobacteraceae bacterium]
MRSGALPLLCWALLLALAGTLNAIWAGISIQTATFGAAVIAILVTASAILARPPHRGVEAIPRASFAAAFTAIGLAVLLFGLTFGHFLIYFGAGMIAVGLGGLARELQAQRRAGGIR